MGCSETMGAFLPVRSRAAARAARAMVSTSVFDVLAGVKHALPGQPKGASGLRQEWHKGSNFPQAPLAR
jgi:hypothetical protein